MSWSAKKRLEFIETRLFWEGKISRKDLTDYFDISIPQATKDFKAYSDLASANIQYDTSAKHYIASSKFNPALISPDSEKYLSELVALDYKNKLFFYSSIPSFYSIPCVRRKVDSSTLKYLLKNIREGNAINVEYQSMNKPSPVWRWITPHAIGFDGFRWHTRALCHKDKEYKDFNIGRMLSVSREKRHDFDHTNDFEWFNDVTFKIAPHRGLTDGQKRCIELDYGMVNGELNFEIKAAFVFYALKRLGLEEGHEKRPAVKQQIILLNRNEIISKIKILKTISSTKIKDMFPLGHK
jgi:hypothetical protein